MNKRLDRHRRAAWCVLALLHGTAAIAAEQVAKPLPPRLAQGDFETPNLPVPSFYYAGELPAGSAWMLGGGGGLATIGSPIKCVYDVNGNCAYDPVGAADGDQVGFIQSGDANFIKQSLILAAGTQRLTLKSAQRPNEDQTINARLDGTQLLAIHPASSTAWQSFSTEFSATAGTHELSFHGVNTLGHSAYLDQVQLESLGLLANGGFETPVLQNYDINAPTGTSWTHSGYGSGIAPVGTVATAAPSQGRQAGMLQAGASMSQAFTVTQAGRYRLSLKSAQRDSGNHQSLRIQIDGSEVGTLEPVNQDYEAFVFDGLKLAAGSHTLTITGQDTVVGYIAMIDDIRLEPLADRSRLWSATSTWASGIVPQAGDSVVIPAGAVVVLDSSGPPNLSSIHIEEGGELHCADQNINLSVEHILVEGRLVCGSAFSPYENRLDVELRGARQYVPPDCETPTGMGVKYIAAMAPGVIELHGRQRKSWTQLAAHAEVNATSITLASVVDWQQGDQIVIAPTRRDAAEAEVFTVHSVQTVSLPGGGQGSAVTFASPQKITKRHHGAKTSYAKNGGARSWQLDARAEVGLLTRNIRIRGDNGSTVKGFGGHMMTMAGSVIHASGIELYRMGQAGMLARYPFHWHMAGDVNGQYIRNSSVHESYNRCVTVHRTNYAEVSDNVCYDFIGHGYFLEDGNEEYNTFDRNLGILARKPAEDEEILETDRRESPTSNGPAVFWLSNPNNTVTNNVAAGTEGSGFWYHTQDHVSCSPAVPGYNPKTQPFGVFDNNRAHSGVQGFSSCEFEGGGWGMDAPNTLITNFTANNVDQALWPCALNHGSMNSLFDNLVVANTPSGLISPSPVTVQNSLFVAHTRNGDGSGNEHPQINADGLWSAIWLYDQGIHLNGVHFVNYNLPQTSVFGSFGGAHKFVSNRAQDISFAATTETTVPTNVFKDLVEATAPGVPMVNWGDVVNDLDGSVAGIAGSAIVSDHPLMVDASCKRPATATIFGYTCPYRYSRFMIVTDKTTPAITATVQRSDGVMGSGATPVPNYITNEYIASGGYIHSYRADQGLDRPYLNTDVANGWNNDVSVHEILDVPASAIFREGTGWSAAASRADLVSGASRRYFRDAESSSLLLKTRAQGQSWFATDNVAFCLTSVTGSPPYLGCAQYPPGRIFAPPKVSITSPAFDADGSLTISASALTAANAALTPMIFVTNKAMDGDGAGGWWRAKGAAPLTVNLAPGSYAVRAVAIDPATGQSYTALQHLVVGEPQRRVAISAPADNSTYFASALPNLQIALYGSDATSHVRWSLNGVDQGMISGTSASLAGMREGRNDIEVHIVNNADNSIRPARDRRVVYVVSNGVLASFEDGIDRRMLLYPEGLPGPSKPVKPSEPPRFAWGFRFTSRDRDQQQDDTNLFVVPYVPGRTADAVFTLSLSPLQDWSAYSSITIPHWGPAFKLYLVNNNTRTHVGSAAAAPVFAATETWNLPPSRNAVTRLEFEQVQPTAACSYEGRHNTACWQYLYHITLNP